MNVASCLHVQKPSALRGCLESSSHTSKTVDTLNKNK